MSAGAGYICGKTPQGRAYCWGENYGGQLGNGTTADSGTPVPVAGRKWGAKDFLVLWVSMSACITTLPDGST